MRDGVCDRNVFLHRRSRHGRWKYWWCRMLWSSGAEGLCLAADYNCGQIISMGAKCGWDNGGEVAGQRRVFLDVADFELDYLPKIQAINLTLSCQLWSAARILSFYRQWAAAGEDKIAWHHAGAGSGEQVLRWRKATVFC